MANQTNISNYIWDFEYYMDYLDILPVNASKLEANRYSIVIAFWIGLVSFVAFLFFILFYISRLDHTPMKEGRCTLVGRSPVMLDCNSGAKNDEASFSNYSVALGSNIHSG